MEDFKIKIRYLKLCYEFRAFIRCMKVAFYRPNFQKLLMFPLIKRLGRAFVLKHVAEPLKHLAELFEILSQAFETLSRAFEGLRENKKLGRELENFG